MIVPGTPSRFNGIGVVVTVKDFNYGTLTLYNLKWSIRLLRLAFLQ